MTRKQMADKDLGDKDMARKLIMLHLPLKTHIDMVTLTLDNLDAKLGALSDTQDALSATELEFLKRFSEQLIEQKTKIESALKTQSSLQGT